MLNKLYKGFTKGWLSHIFRAPFFTHKSHDNILPSCPFFLPSLSWPFTLSRTKKQKKRISEKKVINKREIAPALWGITQCWRWSFDRKMLQGTVRRSCGIWWWVENTNQQIWCLRHFSSVLLDETMPMELMLTETNYSDISHAISIGPQGYNFIWALLQKALCHKGLGSGHWRHTRKGYFDKLQSVRKINTEGARCRSSRPTEINDSKKICWNQWTCISPLVSIGLLWVNQIPPTDSNGSTQSMKGRAIQAMAGHDGAMALSKHPQPHWSCWLGHKVGRQIAAPAWIGLSDNNWC